MRLSGASVEPAEVALSQGIFSKADVVGRGDDRQGSLYCDDHNPPDALACLDGPTGLVELHATLEDVALRIHGPGPLEAVALPNELVDDIDLDARVRPQVFDRSRRAQVGEYQMVVVPHCGRPLRRKVRSAVGTDGRDEAEFRLDNPPHVLGEDPHRPTRFHFRPWSSSRRQRTHNARSGVPVPGTNGPRRGRMDTPTLRSADVIVPTSTWKW